MMRRKMLRPPRPSPPMRQDSSRLSPLVMNNPINQSADWSQDAFLLHDLVSQFTLPQVVRCASRLVPGEEKDLPVNIHVPMLLCDGRSAAKLLARHVGSDSRTHKLTETDDRIVIPSDYDGHFLRLQARTTKDKSVVRSLHHIAHSQIPAFVNLTPVMSFTANRQDMHGSNNNLDASSSEIGGSHVSSKVSKSSSKHSKHSNHLLQQKRTVHPPGSVFVVSGVTKGMVKEKKKSRNVTLVRCSDERGHEVLIPYDQAGEFVEVETPPPGSTKLSVLPADLMSSKRYPALVRYVYGDHAPRLTPCSHMFTLIDTFEEESLIGCLLYPNHALMIEIPLASTLIYQVALNHDEVMSMPLPRHAMSVVKGRREVFVRDLKLKCKFLHRVSPGMGEYGNPSQPWADDDMPSATTRTRQYLNEAFFYL